MIRECGRATEYRQAALQCLQRGAKRAGHLMHGNKFIKRIKTASFWLKIFFRISQQIPDRVTNKERSHRLSNHQHPIRVKQTGVLCSAMCTCIIRPDACASPRHCIAVMLIVCLASRLFILKKAYAHANATHIPGWCPAGRT
jgi:hypothetical protein